MGAITMAQLDIASCVVTGICTAGGERKWVTRAQSDIGPAAHSALDRRALETGVLADSCAKNNPRGLGHFPGHRRLTQRDHVDRSISTYQNLPCLGGVPE